MSTIQIHREAGVHHITLDRPRARNAMSVAMVDALMAALASAEAEGARAVVLRGSEGHFCAGGDIRDMAAARASTDGVAQAIEQLNASFGRLALAYARTGLAVVAVLEGAVMGGGFGLACTADVAIASTTADFRLPETSLGLVPAQIAPFLIERLGFSEAKRLAVTGARLDAAAAAAVGLVHRVCEVDQIDAAVAETLAEVRRCAPEAVAATKALLNRLHGGVGEDDIEHAAQVFATAALGPEAAEGMAAFLAKRPASWGQQG